MKAWEEHAADLYILANDILENQYLQQHGYKSGFYYTFNPHLPYLKTDSTHTSQLKILNQFRDRGAVEFEIREPTPDTPDELISKNAQVYVGKRIKLNINARAFSDLLESYQRYGSKVIKNARRTSRSAKLNETTGNLQIGDLIIKFRPESVMYDMLRIVLKDRESRLQEWSYSEIKYDLVGSERENGDQFLRDTGNNINKRVRSASDDAIHNLLRVTTESVKLMDEFV